MTPRYGDIRNTILNSDELSKNDFRWIVSKVMKVPVEDENEGFDILFNWARSNTIRENLRIMLQQPHSFGYYNTNKDEVEVSCMKACFFTTFGFQPSEFCLDFLLYEFRDDIRYGPLEDEPDDIDGKILE